jgi:hypothetical protein
MSVGTLKTPASVGPIVGITADSQLIEGFLQTTNIQVDPPGLSPRPLSVFMNASGNSEALTWERARVLQEGGLEGRTGSCRVIVVVFTRLVIAAYPPMNASRGFHARFSN